MATLRPHAKACGQLGRMCIRTRRTMWHCHHVWLAVFLMCEPCHALCDAIRGSQDFLSSLSVETLRNVTWMSKRRNHPSGVKNDMFLLFLLTQSLNVSHLRRMNSTISSEVRSLRRENSFQNCNVCPIDADDTAFALRILMTLGWSVDVQSALKPFRYGNRTWSTFVARHNAPQTWAQPSLFGLHPEVHLNVALLHKEHGIRSPVASPLLHDARGLPYCYHYPSRYYVTYLLRSLHDNAYPNYDERILRERRHHIWSAFSEHGYDSVVETSLAILSLSSSAVVRERCLHEATVYLLSRQTQNGRWGSGNPLWVYYDRNSNGGRFQYIHSNPRRSRWQGVDTHAIMSTALASMALSYVRDLCNVTCL